MGVRPSGQAERLRITSPIDPTPCVNPVEVASIISTMATSNNLLPSSPSSRPLPTSDSHTSTGLTIRHPRFDDEDNVPDLCPSLSPLKLCRLRLGWSSWVSERNGYLKVSDSHSTQSQHQRSATPQTWTSHLVAPKLIGLPSSTIHSLSPSTIWLVVRVVGCLLSSSIPVTSPGWCSQRHPKHRPPNVSRRNEPWILGRQCITSLRERFSFPQWPWVVCCSHPFPLPHQVMLSHNTQPERMQTWTF